MIDIMMIIGAILIIFVFTYVYKENPLYRFAEHCMVGVATSVAFIASYKTIVDVLISPLLRGDVATLLLLILSIALFARYVKQYSWLVRWPLAVIAGAGIGVAVRGAAKAQILDQVTASMLKLNDINNVILFIFVICVLGYFLYVDYSKWPVLEGTLSKIGTLGKYFLMIYFGAQFATAAVYRVSLLIGQIQYVMRAFGLLP